MGEFEGCEGIENSLCWLNPTDSGITLTDTPWWVLSYYTVAADSHILVKRKTNSPFSKHFRSKLLIFIPLSVVNVRVISS